MFVINTATPTREDTQMPKINLLKRKTVKIKAAKQKHSQEGEGVAKVWYISKHQNRTNYYVQEVDKENGAIKWTSHRSKALQFHTESGVHHFIHAYMNDRKDIYLIHAAEESK